MTTDLRTAAFLFVALVGYMLMLPRCVGAAHAQSDEDVRIVAIETAHESASIADAYGIASVLRAIARRHGWSLRTAARSYSPRLWRGATRRPWALDVTERCTRTVGSLTPSRCRALFARVRWALASDPCPVDVWGMRSDFDRAEARGRHFAYVQCAEGERNVFATEVTP